MDKARKKTDKILKDLERRVKEVYANDPSLLRIQKKYDQYMKRVDKLTKEDYKAYERESDINTRKKLKKVYTDHVSSLTSKNKEYKKLISEFSRILADVNQKALDLVNDEMTDIYVLNYNQVADQCKKIGVEVNG